MQRHQFLNYFRLLKILLIGLITLGVLLRFVGLDQRPYWFDESFTSLWISGHSPLTAQQALFTGEPLTVADIQQYQTFAANSNLLTTILRLLKYDPQHPPVYYAIAHLWATSFGTSVISIRAISALLSLLALPCAYWLGVECLLSEVQILTFVSLIAISPVMAVYAQEAREYGLWIALILFTSAAFLRAIRLTARRHWLLYGAGLWVGLCTFPFTLWVAVSRGCYLLLWRQPNTYKARRPYGITFSLSLLLFSPWLFRIVTGRSPRLSLQWTAEPLPWATLVGRWIKNVSRVFFDIGIGDYGALPFTLVAIATLALIGYVLIVAYRRIPRSTLLFIICLGGVTVLALVGPDLLFGGRRSTILRYFFPTWIALLLAIAILFGSTLQSYGVNQRHPLSQTLELALVIGLFTSCIISSLTFTQAHRWWIKDQANDYSEIAAVVDQTAQLLLIGGNFDNQVLGDLLALSHSLPPSTDILLFARDAAIEIPATAGDTFLLFPSPTAVDQLHNSGYCLTPIATTKQLSRVGPCPS
jgi:uncharacterized membrane protein